MLVKKEKMDHASGNGAAPDIGGLLEAPSSLSSGVCTVLDKAVPDPEVKVIRSRCNYTAHYKLRILEEVDHCEEGKIASILRREGLYSSHLTKWRRQRKEGSLSGLRPRKRGKPARVLDASTKRIAELEKANSRLSHRLQQAELIIDVQKKVSEMFGICLKPVEEKRKTS
jgi:transposase